MLTSVVRTKAGSFGPEWEKTETLVIPVFSGDQLNTGLETGAKLDKYLRLSSIVLLDGL